MECGVAVFALVAVADFYLSLLALYLLFALCLLPLCCLPFSQQLNQSCSHHSSLYGVWHRRVGSCTRGRADKQPISSYHLLVALCYIPSAAPPYFFQHGTVFFFCHSSLLVWSVP